MATRLCLKITKFRVLEAVQVGEEGGARGTIFFIDPIKGISLRGKPWDYMILRFTI